METKDEIRVMIVDDNESLVGMLKEYFSDHQKIKIVLEAYNGLEKQTVTPELPKEDKVTKQTELSSSSSVATGDTSNVLMLMLLMLISYSGFKLVNK